MNTALVGPKSVAQPLRFAVPSLLAAWQQRLAVALTAAAPAATGLRHLGAGATTWVRRPRGCIVSCRAGTLWLAFDGEPEDVILEPGESHRCTKASALSIHALSAAVVHLG